MSYVINKIKQYKKRWDFARYCFPYGDNARFVREVHNIGEIDNLVYVENYLNSNQINYDQDWQKTDNASALYHIKAEYSGSGFFADHNRLLCYLYFADIHGLIPVVEYNSGYCYAEEHPVNGTTNPFEYYFQQPAGVSLEEMYQSPLVLRSRKDNCGAAGLLNHDGNGYHKSDEFVDAMAEITRKYIKLRPEINSKIEDDISHIIMDKDKTIAVHYRGGDFKRNYNGHPIQASLDEYITEVRALLINDIKGYNRIFLATDDTEAIERFEKEFHGNIVYYKDVARTNTDETVMNSSSTRENHHYLLGLEVLRDMMTLSSCGALVAGLSQVSYAARIQRLSTGADYSDMRILDKGINYHQKLNCPNA